MLVMWYKFLQGPRYRSEQALLKLHKFMGLLILISQFRSTRGYIKAAITEQSINTSIIIISEIMLSLLIVESSESVDHTFCDFDYWFYGI
jgi:hypothetical protein